LGLLETLPASARSVSARLSMRAIGLTTTIAPVRAAAVTQPT